jgi:hypothetical protein
MAMPYTGRPLEAPACPGHGACLRALAMAMAIDRALPAYLAMAMAMAMVLPCLIMPAYTGRPPDRLWRQLTPYGSVYQPIWGRGKRQWQAR